MRIRDLRKRRAVCAVLFTLLLSAVGLTNATAQTFTVGDLNYSINDDGVSVTVTGHVDGQNATGELVIPESVEYEGDSYSVTIIDVYAFRYCSNLTGELIIPNSVTEIRMGAFSYCSGFSSLTIGTGVTLIGSNEYGYLYQHTNPFGYCSGITTIYYNAINCNLTPVGDNWSNAGSPFANCQSLTYLYVGENVQYLPYYAFKNCSALTTLYFNATNCISGDAEWISNCTSLENLFISDNVQAIPSHFVEGCSSLTGNLSIPNSVTTIGDYAFSGCSGLTGSLVIPESMTSIGVMAFANTGFSILRYNAINCQLGTYDGWSGWIVSVFENCPLTTLIIGNNVQFIPQRAFEGLSTLSGTLTLPASLTLIGSNAFNGCSGLTSVVFPESITTIRESAFYACSNLTGELTIPEAVTSIGDRAFANTGFSTVNFNAINCTYMGSYSDPVFVDCGYFSNLNIGENVETIPEYAFFGCAGLTGSLVIPNSVTTIGRSAFRECTGYNGTLTLGNALTYIGGNAFYQCNFTGELTIPNTVEFIGVGAFLDCHGFTGTLTVGTGVTKMGPSAFRRCTGISSVHYNAINWQLDFDTYEEYDGDYFYGTSFISHPVFNECANITTIIIGGQVETIPPCAFMKCSSVTGELTIPTSVTSVGQYAFGMMSISTVNFNATDCNDFPGWNGWWDDDNNYYEGSAFMQCNNLTTVNFGDNVQRIPANVFVNCSTLSGELAIPTSVTEIGSFAFTNCVALNGALSIPNAVVSIGNSAFAGCTGFDGSLTIPESVVTLGGYAFNGCTGLSGSLTIGSSVEFIGEFAFDNTGFSTLNFNAVNCQELGYYYPYGNEDWRPAFHSFPLTTLNFGAGVENIPFRAFRDLTTLTGSLTLSNSLTTIGDQAFYNCYGFESIVMGNSVETIGSEAFRNCGGMRGELTLPETLQTVGNYAFASCDELTTINYNAINCTEMGNAQQPVFYDCASLKHINIGENVQSIPNYAFKRCSTVVDMTVAAVASPTIEASTFGTVSRAIPVNVPFGSGDDYRSAQYWEEFFNIVEGIGQNPYTCHWNANANQFAHNMTAIGIIQIDGVEQTTDALEIGAFCGNECRGSQMLAYYSQVNRYLVFLTLYGEPGDLLTFKLYDHELGEESVLGCTSIVTFEPDGILGTYNNPYVFNFTTVQNTALNEGWSWYSSFVELGNNSLQTMEESLGENGVMIKSQSNGFVINDLGSWMGSLHAVNNESMYLINTSAPCVLSMTGNFAVPSQHTIPLLSGWTWIGYPSAKTVDVNEALVNLNATDGDIIKARNCFAVYAEGNGWFGTLHTLSPGMGFMYHSLSTQSQSFVYGEGSRGVELRENLTAEHNHFVPNVAAYPYNMNVLAVVNLDGEELSSENYELAAFANGECRGSAKLMYVAPMNRYVAFLTVVGNDATTLSFGLYDVANGTVCYDTDDVMIYSNNAIVGSIDEPYVINFRETTGANEFANRINVYPNPVARGEKLNIGMAAEDLGQARVEIVNTLGMTVSSVYAPSEQTIAVPQTAGVYLLRVTMEGKGTYSQKIVVR